MDGLLGTSRQMRCGLRKRYVHLSRPSRQQPRGRAGPGVLLLEDQRYPERDCGQARGRSCVPAGHNDNLRLEAPKEADCDSDGSNQRPRHAQVGHQLTPVEATDREETVFQLTLWEHSSLDAPSSSEEIRMSARPLPDELVGQSQGRVEVPTGAATREDRDGALMHGPSFRLAGAVRRLGRCS